jgi:Sec-independent protein translocase protein TatA
VFGVGKLPQVGNALGKSIRAFKSGQRGDDDDEKAKDDKVKKEEVDTKKA